MSEQTYAFWAIVVGVCVATFFLVNAVVAFLRFCKHFIKDTKIPWQDRYKDNSIKPWPFCPECDLTNDWRDPACSYMFGAFAYLVVTATCAFAWPLFVLCALVAAPLYLLRFLYRGKTAIDNLRKVAHEHDSKGKAQSVDIESPSFR